MFLQQRHNLAGSFDVRKHKFRALFGLKPSILSVIQKKKEHYSSGNNAVLSRPNIVDDPTTPPN